MSAKKKRAKTSARKSRPFAVTSTGRLEPRLPSLNAAWDYMSEEDREVREVVAHYSALARE